MTKEKIQEIINNKLKSEPNIKNVFGLDLTKCLVTPTKENYFNDTDTNESENLWTVLQESPRAEGYTIYFDEETGQFGLGVKSKEGRLVDIGSHGTFLQTLYSM
jgi:hypothetical protein